MNGRSKAMQVFEAADGLCVCLARSQDGRRVAAKIARMAIMANNSVSVKPFVCSSSDIFHSEFKGLIKL